MLWIIMYCLGRSKKIYDSSGASSTISQEVLDEN